MLSGVFNKNEKGFTLIEIILISVIVLLIGVSIIVPFRGGKKTWQSADKDSETIQNAVIGMEKVVREIKNSPGLTAFATTAIRFAILRKDDDPNDPDIDLDGITDEYVTKYAMVKKDGDYLKYGERSADSASEGDWTLSDLAYPVTNLSFSFKKANGDDANPGDDPADVKSILINLTTSDGGVTIPLTSRAYLVMGESSVEYNFDGTPDDPDDEGEDEHHFNEGDEELPDDEVPPPGSKGDGVGGWSLSDYAVWGDSEVDVDNSVEIFGNAGTRNLSGNPYESVNSCEVHGYLVVKGSLVMKNTGCVSKDSVAAGCIQGSADSTSLSNQANIEANIWTLKDISVDNKSHINGTVYQLAGANISSGYDKRVEITEKPTFMKDPIDEDVAWGDSVFPMLPEATEFELPGGADLNLKKKTQTLNAGNYGDVSITNSSRITIKPFSYFENFSVANSSQVIFAATGDYFFNRIEIGNSSKLIFNFNDEDGSGTGPIRLFIKDEFALNNSSSFDYYQGGVPIDGANLLYVEAQNGFSCSNSVQWKGFIYSPNGDIKFVNSSSLTGAAYAKGKVELGNSSSVTYVAPLYMEIAKLLPDLFYPQLTP